MLAWASVAAVAGSVVMVEDRTRTKQVRIGIGQKADWSGTPADFHFAARDGNRDEMPSLLRTGASLYSNYAAEPAPVFAHANAAERLKGRDSLVLHDHE